MSQYEYLKPSGFFHTFTLDCCSKKAFAGPAVRTTAAFVV